MAEKMTIEEALEVAKENFGEEWEREVHPLEPIEQAAQTLAAEVRRLRQGWISVEEWLPEADVPVIAFFVNECGKARRIRAFYAPRHTIETSVDRDWYEMHNDESYLPEGWYEMNEYEDVHWFIDCKVTHWQPLPEPPHGD